MKRETFNVLFFVKRARLLKTGEAPVYMRITINSESVEISIKRGISPLLWDVPRNKAKGKSKEALELNDYLGSIKGQIYVHQQIMQEKGKLITPETLMNAYQGIGEKTWGLLELFEDHNTKMAELIGIDYSPLTLQRYKAAIKHLSIFINYKYNLKELPLKEVDNKFVVGFEHYLKTIANCAHNSAMKHMKALKKVIRIALADEYITRDPFSNYEISTKEVIRDYLSADEIETILNKEFEIKRLEVIRDLFIFQCYTGLAYVDLSTLNSTHIEIGIDGYKWIILRRGKTGTECRIPILPVAEQIIAKYSKHPHVLIKGTLLPVPSNQKMNAYLKEVADLCGVNKLLHTHLARHTFASTVTLSNGTPIESISKMLGHKKISTTQIYAKVSDEKISSDMQKLREKLA